MRRVSFFVFALLIFPVLAFAQLANDKKVDWKVFAPDGEEFSTEVPFPLDGKGGTAAYRRYSGNLNGTYFFIFSEPRNNPFTTKKALEYIRSFQKSGNTENFGGIETEKFAFDDDEGFIHQVFQFNTAKRTYLIHAVSATKHDPLIERFFGKLEIGKLNGAAVSEPADGDKVINVMIGNDSGLGAGTGSGRNEGVSGMGSGIGSGSGGGISSSPAARPSAEVTASPLKIISKPRPSYTDIARIYSVSGTIRLRVNFGPDGNIGPVEAVTHLPFGLTKSAITAAKSMKFEPQIQNGEAVNVAKLVEYTFAVY